MRDCSFLRFFKNDFASAKRGDNSPIVTIPYDGFIVQKPNEIFAVKTASSFDIAFAGGITVDLVDCSDTVRLNIDNKFFPASFTDTNGVQQIDFEFGNIGQDFSTTPLYLRITDNGNGNKFYSNNFLVTNYETDLSVRLDFWHPTQINNFGYDVRPFKQSIRLSKFYLNDTVNEEKEGNYTQYGGNLVSYRSIITDLDQYITPQINRDNYTRLLRLFQSAYVYLNGVRVTKSALEKEERKGDTNWFPAKLTVNPKDETFTPTYQLYQPFNAISTFVAQGSTYTLINFNTALGTGLYINFNNTVFVDPSFQYELFENGTSVLTGTAYTLSGNRIYLDDLQTYTFSNNTYEITASGLYNGVDVWGGFALGDWTFIIAAGEFDASEFDNTEFLTV